MFDCRAGTCGISQFHAMKAKKASIYCGNNCFGNSYYLTNAQHVEVVFDVSMSLWPGYSCNIYAENSELLHMTLASPYTPSDGGKLAISAPQKTNGTNLDCIDLGCQYIDWTLQNGLKDINVTHSGICNSLWIDSWDITCLIDNSFVIFDGSKCSDESSACCTESQANKINSVYLDTCPLTDDDKIKGWEIALIIIGGLLVLIFVIVGLIWYKRRRAQDSRYETLN